MKKKLFMVAALLMSQNLFALPPGATDRGAAFDYQMAQKNAGPNSNNAGPNSMKGTGYGSPYARRLAPSNEQMGGTNSATEPRMMRSKARGHGHSAAAPVANTDNVAALKRQIADLKRKNHHLKNKWQQACADGGKQCPLPSENAVKKPTQRNWR